MAKSLKCPEPFSFTASDVAAEWKLWSRSFNWYLKATLKEEKDEEVLVGVLLTLLGTEGLKIYDTFTFTTGGDDKKIKPVLKKFDEYFEPRSSEFFNRFKFHRRHQQPGESFEAWLVDLTTLVKNCGYGNTVDSMLRDQIVMGVYDAQAREKMLYEKNPTLQEVCNIVRAVETSKMQIAEINSDTATVHRLAHFGERKQKSNTESSRFARESNSAVPDQPRCRNCGSTYHTAGDSDCKALEIVCHKCSKVGHFARWCDRKGRNRPKQPTEALAKRSDQVHTVGGGEANQQGEYSFENDYVVHEISHSDKEEKEWYSVLSVDGVKIKFKLDSGATCNVIPRELFHSLPQRRIQRLRPGGPRVKGYGANGRFLHVLGISTCKVDHRGKVSVIDLIVVDEPGQPPILGLPSCKSLNLIKRVDDVTKRRCA
jgi:hypothetical protein